MGTIHLRHLRQAIPGASVVAVSDAFCDKSAFEKEHPGVFFTADADEAIAKADAVVIATPTSTHAALVEKCIAAGRPLFCEKPLDLSLEVTVAVLQKAAKAGVKLMLGFNLRFDPDFMQARQAVGEGKIGNPRIVKTPTATRPAAGQLLKNLGRPVHGFLHS